MRNLVRALSVRSMERSAYRFNAKPPTTDHDHRNDLRADDADVRRLDNQCDYRAEQPHGRSRGRADGLIHVRERDAQASTDLGSLRSLRPRVPRCAHRARAAYDHGRDNQHGPRAERRYGHSLGRGCANLRG